MVRASCPGQPLRHRIASNLLSASMVLVAALMGLVTAGLVIPFAGVAGIGARDVARSMDDLPEELETTDLAQRTQVVDGEGNVIAQLYDENRITVPLSQISRKMLEAIVAIEDYRFYQHGALDLKGTVRALVTNQMDGGTVQGGSSITQQLVKLTLVDQAESKEEQQAAVVSDGMAGYARKLKELRYAIALEKEHSKDWILERYLNTAYFGDGAFGIQSAAKHYFGVNAKDLNYPQSAMLAGMVKNPTAYDPTNNPETAPIERRNVVLQRMAELGVIPQKQADKLKAQKLRLKLEKINNGCVNSRAPFFCQYARAYLLQDPDLGKTVKEREQLLNSGGLTIHTTVDLKYPGGGGQAVQGHVYPTDQAIGALAMVQPKTEGEDEAVSAVAGPMWLQEARRGQTHSIHIVGAATQRLPGGSAFGVRCSPASVRRASPSRSRSPHRAGDGHLRRGVRESRRWRHYRSAATGRSPNRPSEGSYDIAAPAPEVGEHLLGKPRRGCASHRSPEDGRASPTRQVTVARPGADTNPLELAEARTPPSPPGLCATRLRGDSDRELRWGRQVPK